MKKNFPKISTFVFTLTLVFVMSGFLFPQTANAETYQECLERGGSLEECNGLPGTPPTPEQEEVDSAGPGFWGGLGEALLFIPGAISIGILKIASLLTYLAGALLNLVVQYSVVDMKVNIEKAGVINLAWRTIRDVANMTFIFILLYAAIQTILGIGSDVKKLIVNVIVVAILINFSLFFTKVIIDASNVLAITFYDAIAPGALTGNAEGLFGKTGIADSLMQPLKITSIWNPSELRGSKLLTIGVMGTIVTLIAAFVFFAVAIMFIIRFVVLIFVLILSPLAFMGFIMPQLAKYKNRWWEALSGQAFFAPIYFMLTWIVIIVSRGLLTSGGSMADALTGTIGASGRAQAPSPENLAILMNFVIMIVLLIASLIIAKEWANKAGPGVTGLTKWAMGAAGGAAFGGLGWTGRTTFGRAGATAAESTRLQEAANKQRTSAWDRTKGAAARLALYASKKARSGSFDARSATIPTSAIGAAIEGTVGRTRAGKILGLNDVNIPSIPVGAFAAGQTGVGEGGEKGFVETREESRKRVEEREKAADNELRKARSKNTIKKGTAGGASPAEIIEMQKIIKDMTNKEVAALEQNTLANKNVAEALTAQHLKAIDDSDRSESDKRFIFTAHFTKVYQATEILRTGISPTTGAPLTDAEKRANQNILRNISDKELDYIPTSIFDPSKLDPATPAGTTPEGRRSQAFLKAITQAQVDNLTKGDKLISSEKQAVKDGRTRPLNEAFAAGNYIGTPDSAVEIMREMRPEALVQLDNAKLTNPNIFELYTPALLNKMAARSELTEGKALAIRTAISAAGPGAPGSNQEAAFNWLHGDGLNIF
ncbi:MAG: hypothetical protein HYT68_01595 [Candidatus Zambryskibacteria bacterium]|nr:hypothetical protein [Candidatus Zambryskibacteria bacterium]